MSMTDLQLSCQPSDAGWRCEVTVGDDPGATRHSVEVPRECVERLDPGADSPERLVESSFEFLLEREPRESIMSAFELTIITRFFPEWEHHMQRRLGA